MDKKTLRSLKTECDDYLEAKFGDTGIPGTIFIALARDGSVVYSRDMGTREANCAHSMTDDTMFWVASCVKIFTAMSIMKCVEQGLVTLDANILEHVPELAKQPVRQATDEPGKYTIGPRTEPITLRMLMTNTAGVGYPPGELSSPEALEDLATGKGPWAQAKVEFHAGGPLKFQPGEKWEYGGSMEWAGRVVESVTGRRLGDFMAEYILEPSGVRDITFELTEDQHSRMAASHFRWPDGRVTVRGKFYSDDVIDHCGGSGLYATAPDFAQALLPLINGGVHPITRKRILESETVRDMFAAQLTSEQVLWLDRPSLISEHILSPGVEKQWGLSGLLMPKGSPTGRGEGTATWFGGANTHWMADPTKGIVMVLFAQVVSMPLGDERLLTIRDELEKIIYQRL